MRDDKIFLISFVLGWPYSEPCASTYVFRTCILHPPVLSFSVLAFSVAPEIAVLPQTMNMMTSRTNVLAQTGTLILWFIAALAGHAACVVGYINKSLSNWRCHCRRQRHAATGQVPGCNAERGAESCCLLVLIFNTNMYESSIADIRWPHLVSHFELPIYSTWQTDTRPMH